MNPSFTGLAGLAGVALAPTVKTVDSESTAARTAPHRIRLLDIVCPFSGTQDRQRGDAARFRTHRVVTRRGRERRRSWCLVLGEALSSRSLGTSDDERDDLLVGVGARDELPRLASTPEHHGAVGHLHDVVHG